MPYPLQRFLRSAIEISLTESLKLALNNMVFVCCHPSKDFDSTPSLHQLQVLKNCPSTGKIMLHSFIGRLFKSPYMCSICQSQNVQWTLNRIEKTFYGTSTSWKSSYSGAKNKFCLKFSIKGHRNSILGSLTEPVKSRPN